MELAQDGLYFAVNAVGSSRCQCHWLSCHVPLEG